MDSSSKKTDEEKVLYLKAVLACVAAFGFGFVVGWFDKTDLLRDAGGFLGGCAAVAAVWFAATKGPKELEEWKERRILDREAEVAGKALVAAIEFGPALHRLNLVAKLSSDPLDKGENQTNWDVWWSRYDRRMADVKDEHDAFRRAANEAEAWLPEPAVQKLRDLWTIFYDIRNVWLRATWQEPNDKEQNRDRLEIQRRVDPAVEQAKEVLRQYTRRGRDSS